MCKERNEFYDGAVETKRTGRIPILDIKSDEACIIAFNLE